jgi:hypothetical protein
VPRHQLNVKLDDAEVAALGAFVAQEQARAREAGLPVGTITAASVVRQWIREHDVRAGGTGRGGARTRVLKRKGS